MAFLFTYWYGSNVSVVPQSFWKANLSEVDVVVLFSPINEIQKDKLAKELRKGTRVVSYKQQIYGWKPIRVSFLEFYFI